ncbi:MAG TPA: sulfate ABC transporter permease subunit CysT [Verrucomicrobiae bacterium]|nr:sulfate ABC transporter permease subunit CysT [Verrucomicrobiae bacterium]
MTKSRAAAARYFQPTNPLPGFSITLGFTIIYLTVIVLVPIGALALKALGLSWKELWELATNERAMASYRLSLGASLAAALINAAFGTLLAWVLARYRFPGRRLLDGLIDFPFALPTAVAGLTLASLFSDHGWLGQYLAPLGIKGAFSRLGVVIALTFVGLPFSVRTVQPEIETLDPDVQEAAKCLGAGRLRLFFQVTAPALLPTVLTGFGLSFARALGEYGSIVFISGNLPFQTEIAPTLVVMRLDQFDYTGAISVALVLMIFSFALLLTLNSLQGWAAKFQEP